MASSWPVVLIFGGETYASWSLAHGLTARGYAALVVYPTEVQFLLESHRVTAVLVDMDSPDYDGLHECRQLSRMFPGPILALSAYGGEEARDMAMKAGATVLVSKPVDPDELSSHLEELGGRG